MSVHQLHDRTTQPVRLNLPTHIWDRLQDMTKPGLSVQDIVVAVMVAFVEQEAVNSAGKQ